jgi:hypothetical protein
MSKSRVLRDRADGLVGFDEPLREDGDLAFDDEPASESG